MNVTKRFLVLNSANQVQSPSCHGVHLPDLQSDKSPSFLKKETAMAFADILAAGSKGAKFYVAEILAGTVQYTEAEPPGEWKDATAADTAE